jgi:hypothetical protein
MLIIPSLGVPNWSVIYINTAPSSDKRPSRLEILDKCSAHQEAARISEFDIFAGGESRSQFGDPPTDPVWKTKE